MKVLNLRENYQPTTIRIQYNLETSALYVGQNIIYYNKIHWIKPLCRQRPGLTL